MKTATRRTPTRPMDHDAYAGFLKLWLTPASKVPRPSAELDAYLSYLAEAAPLSETTRLVAGLSTVKAA